MAMTFALLLLSVAVATYVVVGTAPSYKSIGCFKDKSSRAISGGKQNFNHNTIQNCALKALRQGNQYFGVQYNTQCFTSSNAGSTYNRYGASTGCSNGKGGFWAQNVYAVQAPLYESIGCFKDKSSRAISGGKQNYNDNTIQNCALKALRQGNQYFAVQYNTQCFTSSNAGSTYNRYGTSTGCSNGKGGFWAQNVYVVQDFHVPEYHSIGCFADKHSRAISGGYQTFKDNVIQNCALRASRLGYQYFAVQYNTQCFTSSNAGSTYNRYGSSTGCSNDKGGFWAQNVYAFTG